MNTGFNEVMFDRMKDECVNEKDLSIETGIAQEKIHAILFGEVPDQYDADLIARALGTGRSILFQRIKP